MSKPWFLLSNRPKHIALGLCIYAAALLVAFLLGLGLVDSSLVGLMCAATAAITKEFTDRQHGGCFDLFDALATVMLPVALTLIIILISVLWLK